MTETEMFAQVPVGSLWESRIGTVAVVVAHGRQKNGLPLVRIRNLGGAHSQTDYHPRVLPQRRKRFD